MSYDPDRVREAMASYAQRPQTDLPPAGLAPGKSAPPKRWRESDDQRKVCQYLTAIKVWHSAPFPETGQRSDHAKAYRRIAWLRARGFESGMPDLLIWDPPPDLSGRMFPAALELKVTGARGKAAQPSNKQAAWADKHRDRGRIYHCAAGWAAAIAWLRSLGYP